MGASTQIIQLVKSSATTKHKLYLQLSGGIGMSTLRVGKQMDKDGNLIKPAEFVFYTEELVDLQMILEEFMKTISALQSN